MFLAICCLTDNLLDYHFVSQGKLTVNGMDDAEEMYFTDVRLDFWRGGLQLFAKFANG